MQYPDQLRNILIDIVSTGLLRIRNLADARDSQACLVEADHIHNLPELIKTYSPDLLSFYWNISREVFVEQCAGRGVGSFASLWDQLQPFLR